MERVPGFVAVEVMLYSEPLSVTISRESLGFKNMKLTELTYVVAVAREGHFGRAAAACFVTQPTLSIGVKRFEEELNLHIFERNRNEVIPTLAGKRVIAQANRVLEEVALLEQIASSGGDELAGPLRLGAIYTIGPYLLPRLITALRERAPNMPLLVEENYTARLAERLQRGELDAIIVSLPFQDPGVVTESLYSEPFVVLVSDDHPLAQQETITSEELERETVLLLGPGHCVRDQVLAACPGCGNSGRLANNVEGSSLETIRYMVASGMGVTVLPYTVARGFDDTRRLGTMRPFAGDPPMRQLAIAWRASYPRPRAIGAVAATIRAFHDECISSQSAEFILTPLKRIA